MLKLAISAAHQAARELADLSSHDRSAAITTLASTIKANKVVLLEANTLDLEASREMEVPPLLLDWLKLTPERLDRTVQLLQTLAALPDPLYQPVLMADLLGAGRTCPIGVVAFIHEALPHLSAVAAGLCLKTGNALILKGSPEASYSQTTWDTLLQSAIVAAGLSSQTIFAPDGDTSTRDLLTLPGLNLAIPYGRPSWVDQMARQATVPLLKPAIGNCYLYWGRSGSREEVLENIVASHCGDPEAVNAIEKVLVHDQHMMTELMGLWEHLSNRGFELFGDESLVAQFADLKLLPGSDWSRTLLRKAVAFRCVSQEVSATAWINAHSSGHADVIVSDDYREIQTMIQGLTSAVIYVNQSSRFSRHSHSSGQVLLGMANAPHCCRGGMGLSALMMRQGLVQGTVGWMSPRSQKT